MHPDSCRLFEEGKWQYEDMKNIKTRRIISKIIFGDKQFDERRDQNKFYESKGLSIIKEGVDFDGFLLLPRFTPMSPIGCPLPAAPILSSYFCGFCLNSQPSTVPTRINYLLGQKRLTLMRTK